MRKVLQVSSVAVVFSLVLSLVFSPAIFAQEQEGTGESPATRNTTETENETDTRKSDDSIRVNPEIRQEVARKRLEERKKTVCEARQESINTRMGNISERSQNHFDRIGAIYTATNTFYEANNLLIEDYDRLVGAVNETETAAQSALEALQAAPKLSCDSDGPKADVQNFLNLRLSKVSSFNAYRDAVKAFVKAVKAAAEVNVTSGEAT